MIKPGPAIDERRIFAVMCAIMVYQTAVGTLPKSTDLIATCANIWPDGESWNRPKMNRTLEDAARAGLVIKHELTPSLFAWEVNLTSIDIRKLTQYLNR